MNRYLACALSVASTVAAAAAATAMMSSVALADDITIDPTPPPSEKSRAEVRAELKKRGPNPWSITYDPIAQMKGTRTRQEVRDEYIASRDQVQAFTGEDSGSAYLAQSGAYQGNGYAMTWPRRRK